MPATAPLTAVPPCPKCRGEMYDNRLDKAGPRSADFRCKDPDCRTPVWLTPLRREKHSRQAPAAASQPNGNGRRPVSQQGEIAPQNGDGGHVEPPEVWRTYRWALGAVLGHVAPRLVDEGFKVATADVLSAVAVLVAHASSRGR